MAANESVPAFRAITAVLNLRLVALKYENLHRCESLGKYYALIEKGGKQFRAHCRVTFKSGILCANESATHQNTGQWSKTTGSAFRSGAWRGITGLALSADVDAGLLAQDKRVASISWDRDGLRGDFRRGLIAGPGAGLGRVRGGFPRLAKFLDAAGAC